jgi:hypothetical protein
MCCRRGDTAETVTEISQPQARNLGPQHVKPHRGPAGSRVGGHATSRTPLLLGHVPGATAALPVLSLLQRRRLASDGAAKAGGAATPETVTQHAYLTCQKECGVVFVGSKSIRHTAPPPRRTRCPLRCSITQGCPHVPGPTRHRLMVDLGGCLVAGAVPMEARVAPA